MKIGIKPFIFSTENIDSWTVNGRQDRLHWSGSGNGWTSVSTRPVDKQRITEREKILESEGQRTSNICKVLDRRG